MKRLVTPRAATVLLALVPFLGAGCTSLDASELVPANFTTSKQHPKSVRIEAEGSPRKMKLGSRDIGADELQLALREAVLTSGVFQRVIEDGRADYVLSVTAASVEKSDLGLDMTATASLLWSLRDMADGATVWERTIDTVSEANPRDADFVDERRRVAVEGAIRDNLARGLKEIAALDL